VQRTALKLEMNRLITFIVFALVFIVSMYGTEKMGVKSEQVNSQYYFSAGTSVLALVLSPLFLAFLFLRSPSGIRETTITVVPLWRRFAAFIIDLSAALFAIASILALPALIMEWNHTGVMVWQFTRDFPRSTDFLVSFWPTVLAFFWLIFYFSYPLTKRDQTIGQFILGYRIAKGDVSRIPYKTAIIRVIVSFFVMCAGWITIPLAFFDTKKYMLHDNEDGFRPELVIYKK